MPATEPGGVVGCSPGRRDGAKSFHLPHRDQNAASPGVHLSEETARVLAPVCRRAKMRVASLFPFPSPNMTSDNPSPPESDPEQNIRELLVHVSELAKRVERLPSGPLKTKLRIALAEIDAHFDELKSSKD